MIDGLEFSKECGEIAKALVAAQRECSSVLKDAQNPAFKSKYASLSSVLDACRPAFLKAGIAILQPPSASYEDGSAFVAAETFLLHESGQWARAILELQPTKSDPQAIGSAATYGRRYQMLGLSGLAPEDDDGNVASRKDESAAALADLQAEFGSYKSAVEGIARRITSRGVDAVWQARSASDISAGRTKNWAELTHDEMLVFYRAIDSAFARAGVAPAEGEKPPQDVEKPAREQTLATPPETRVDVDAAPKADEMSPAGSVGGLSDPEQRRQSMLAYVEMNLAKIYIPEEELQSYASSVRESTLTANPEADLSITYDWRELSEFELRSFYGLVPKKGRKPPEGWRPRELEAAVTA